MTVVEGTRSYPEQIRLGSDDITLRYMTASDADAILAFARALPEHDLLFLRRDITDPEGVAAWVRDVESGDTISVLAVRGSEVVGYGTIHRNKVGWSQHVGELRVLVAESMRGKGLGRVLTQEAFAIALGQGIEKMMAQMTLDQKGAIATFEGIGFRPEALLRDHVKDRAGKKHDLLVLSHEVAKFESTLNAYGVSQAFE
jgi:L-amino acid N-acyltransferase YncA